MRLYLFDVPEGSSMRILAIAIVARREGGGGSSAGRRLGRVPRPVTATGSMEGGWDEESPRTGLGFGPGGRAGRMHRVADRHGDDGLSRFDSVAPA